jgi:predicted ATPase
MSTLLERERELAEVHAIVGECSDGRGRLLVVEAQAGLGKTRLLQAARQAGAEAGMRVLSARATELERDFPFALVRQLLVPPLVAMTAAERDRRSRERVPQPAARWALRTTRRRRPAETRSRCCTGSTG